MNEFNELKNRKVEFVPQSFKLLPPFPTGNIFAKAMRQKLSECKTGIGMLYWTRAPYTLLCLLLIVRF